MENYTIPKKVIDAIVDYLMTRPYREVASGLEELGRVIREQENQAAPQPEITQTPDENAKK